VILRSNEAGVNGCPLRAFGASACAPAQRDKNAKKKALQKAAAAYKPDIESALQTIRDGIKASKAKRDALIEELLGSE
jgi:predicted  nucleic acid-binding Zn-ribbon protein